MHSVGEYAKLHGVSRVTVHKWIQRGDLVARKHGRFFVILGNQPKPKPRGRGKGKNTPKIRMKKLGLVKQYTKEGEFVAEYPTIKEASKALNTTEANICQACNGITRTAKGYVWKRSNTLGHDNIY